MILKAELRSSHPLARGIASWCEENAIGTTNDRVEVLELSYIAGKGLEAQVRVCYNDGADGANKSYRLLVGTPDLIVSRGLPLSAQVSFIYASTSNLFLFLIWYCIKICSS